MATLETRLIASLTDRISAPARKASEALRGLASSTNTKVGGVFSSINREIGYTNRSLDNMRGRVVEAIGQAYLLKNALQAPIQSAIDFETTLTDIGQKTDQNRQQMKEFGRYVRDLAPATNKTALELAKAQDVLVGMGMEFETAKQALPLLGKAATAYRVEIADAAKMSMAFVDNLKIKINELPDAFDRASAAGKAGAVELKDMAQYMPAIGAIAASKGMAGQKAVLQVATALQITRKGAGDAAQAASNLKNVFQKMTSTETMKKFGDQALIMDQLSGKLKMSKDKKAAKAIEKYYESQWLKAQLELRQKKGLSPLEAFVDVTKDMLARNKGMTISDFFADQEVQLGMASLIQNYDEWQKMMKEVEATYKGGTERDYAERLNDLAQKVGGLNAAWETFKITIGGTLGPILVPVLQNLTQMAGRLADLAEKFPGVTRYVTIGATALIGFKIAVTGVSWAFLSLKVAALTTLAALSGWLAPLAALAAAVYLLYQRWDQVKALMPNVAKAVETAVAWMKENWSTLPGKVWEVAVSIKDKLLNTDWMQVGRDMISSLWAGMKEWLNKILAGVGDFVGKVKGLFVGSASASTGGSATSMGGATGGSSGGGGYTAAAERMRRLSGGGASGATPSSGRGGGATPSASGGATPNIAGRGGTLDRMLAGSGGGFNVRGVKNMNPGNIAYGPWARAHGAIGSAGRDTGHGVAVFPSHAAGAAALETLALGKYNGGKRSIDALIAGKGGWTPGNHAAAANVARMMGISPHADARLSDKAMMRKFRNALMVQELGPGGARHVIGKLAGRARGGPVHAGQSYVVGEQGWEIYRPSKSGQIVNQKQLAAEGRGAAHGGQTIHFAPTIHVNGATDPQQVANQVERHIRNKLGSIFRGSHSDIGFAPV
jgi:TP901 family phage tail tape measure protein